MSRYKCMFLYKLFSVEQNKKLSYR